MTQFVIVYDRHSGESRIREFDGPSAAEDALAARFVAESTAGLNEEVVTMSARSREVLARTHSRYFKGVDGAMDDLAAASA